MKEVQVKVRPGRVVNGNREGEVITVTKEQAEQLENQGAVSRVDEKKQPAKKD